MRRRWRRGSGRWALLLMVAAAACSGGDAPPADATDGDASDGDASDGDANDGGAIGPPADAPTPWQQATVEVGAVSGAFSVLLGDPNPGGGWFQADDAQGAAFARAARHAVDGATWPVVAVRIHGNDGAGWSELELDVSLDAWVAGDVPLDGQGAIGQLTTPDGRVRYLQGGALTLTAAGVEDGDRVRGSFEAVPLWEAP